GSRNSAFRRLYARRGMLSVLCIIIAGQWAIVTFGGEMFRCVPLSASEWLTIIVATSPVVIIGEIYRYIQGRRSGTAI
ncbi:MAG: cation-translocating P-type ATPase C-terminal domain-containing protein, partial [Bacteroidales bacterium]|nr:cation-translocating P-type ATPase C-terminal domain-containing protein [Bacteroidales bacterium]